jgi:hypothetical protein
LKVPDIVPYMFVTFMTSIRPVPESYAPTIPSKPPYRGAFELFTNRIVLPGMYERAVSNCTFERLDPSGGTPASIRSKVAVWNFVLYPEGPSTPVDPISPCGPVGPCGPTRLITGDHIPFIHDLGYFG